MKSLNSTVWRTRGLVATLATIVAGGLGCGATEADDDISATHDALNVGGWSQLVAMGTTGSYVLTANIDATGKTWTPKDFSGTFDGGRFTISNLKSTNGGFFAHLNNATVTNLKLTNLTVTGSNLGGAIGGLANYSNDSNVQYSAVEGNINITEAVYAANFIGSMNGGTVYRSYAKGNLTGVATYAGGLFGSVSSSSIGMATVTESYSQVTVTPSTASGDTVYAGGVAGILYGSDIHDVYAVGKVSGRGAVGGIVGYAFCTTDVSVFFLYKAIHRGGDVVDANWGTAWGGVAGYLEDCSGVRATNLFWETTTDPATTSYSTPSVVGASTTALRSPTSPSGGVYCQFNPMTGHCADNDFADPPWNAGTSTQHHTLRSVSGPNVQPL